MQKRLIAVCLLIALISSNFSSFFVYFSFEANQKYIAETLCVNKSRPWMHCNGKCYLIKKLRQAEEKEKNQQRQSQRSLIQSLYVMNAVNVKFHSALLQIIATPYHSPEHSMFTGSIFHPPKFA